MLYGFDTNLATDLLNKFRKSTDDDLRKLPSIQNGHATNLVTSGWRAWKICRYQAQHFGVGCSMMSDDLFPAGCHLLQQLTWKSSSQHVPASQRNAATNLPCIRMRGCNRVKN